MALTSLAIGPLPERRQHNRIRREVAQVVDANGAIGSPFRVESLLGRLERHGDIGQRERMAGEEFQHLFRLAHLDPLRAADLGQLREQPWRTTSTEWARYRLNKALDALGGHASPCGACAWYVLGVELSIREWALRQGWAGKPVNPHVAKGMLLSALGILAKHFG